MPSTGYDTFVFNLVPTVYPLPPMSLVAGPRDQDSTGEGIDVCLDTTLNRLLIINTDDTAVLIRIIFEIPDWAETSLGLMY